MSKAGDLTWLVALGAALWGTDALLRLPLTHSLPATVIVVAEHAIVVLVLIPWLPRAFRAFKAMSAGASSGGARSRSAPARRRSRPGCSRWHSAAETR
ncbi:hypothetical protein [Fodinicola feengrottensis]|uniref:hypothetical protein n=1 Tax=Fodinicola feengrottensis TaxID=435914 RepID=UPI0024427AE7|nr:hypothetical protein [Fodinicola feengrottensis]